MKLPLRAETSWKFPVFRQPRSPARHEMAGAPLLQIPGQRQEGIAGIALLLYMPLDAQAVHKDARVRQ